MSKHRPSHLTAKVPAPAAAPAVRPAVEAPAPASPWTRFWFTPTDPIGLQRLRVLAGLLFLGWLLPFAGQTEAFYSLDGWFGAQAYQEVSGITVMPGMPSPFPISWSLLYVFGRNPGAVAAFYWLSMLVLGLFTVGLWPRVTAVLTWVIVVSFTANPATFYDADYMLMMLAFYLMVGYLLVGQRSDQPTSWRILGPGGVWPFDSAAQGPGLTRDSVGANVAVRLLQVHFAIVLVVSALHKLQFGDWWSGLALWYPLHRPFETTADAVNRIRPYAHFYLFLLSIGTYAGLVWELAFPLFAWRQRLWARVVLLGGGVVFWLSMIFIYQLPLFGPFVLVCCLAYLTPAEWRLLSLPSSWSRSRPVPARSAAPRVAPEPAVSSVHVRQP